MPIFFVVCGVMLLCFLFNFFNVYNNIYKCIICIFLFIICISYFCESISICDVHFNLIQIFILCILLLFALYNSTHKFKAFILSSLSILAYYFFVNFVISNNDNVSYLLIVMSTVSTLSFDNFFDGFLCNILCGISMGIINVCKDVRLYTFAILDTNIIFTSILVFVLTFVIRTRFFYKSNLFERRFCNDFKNKTI